MSEISPAAKAVLITDAAYLQGVKNLLNDFLAVADEL